MKHHYIFLLLAIIFNVAANLMVKGFAAKNSKTIMEMITNIPLYIAIGLFGINFIFYTKALNTMNISVAYPILVGLSILLIVTLSLLFFSERLNSIQGIGIGFVVLGIVLIFIKM